MEIVSLGEIAQIIGLHLDKSSEDFSVSISGVAVDSRLVSAGDLFFALPGDHANGHDYLEQAFANGARAAVISSDYSGSNYGFPLLRCDDVLKALQLFAKKTLEASSLRVVGVTGSIGKTTTKDFLTILLKQKYSVSSSPGNSNSQIGLPLTILNHTNLEDELLILEMGMTHPNQIKQLVQIAPPEVALITKVALVHACNFDSLAGIAQAKAEIFTHPVTKLGVYHLSSATAGIDHIGCCPKKTFSMEFPEANYFGSIENGNMIIREDGKIAASLPLLYVPGEHNYSNFLGAVAVARAFGVSWDQIACAQASLVLPERRLESVEKFGVTFINDSYNASEESVKAALRSMPSPKPGKRRIAVLGGMMELGKFSEGCHRSVAEESLKHVDMMFCFGVETLPILESWQKANKKIVWTETRANLVAALQAELQLGDVVLLKGSRSKQLWKVLDELHGLKAI